MKISKNIWGELNVKDVISFTFILGIICENVWLKEGQPKREHMLPINKMIAIGAFEKHKQKKQKIHLQKLINVDHQ